MSPGSRSLRAFPRDTIGQNDGSHAGIGRGDRDGELAGRGANPSRCRAQRGSAQGDARAARRCRQGSGAGLRRRRRGRDRHPRRQRVGEVERRPSDVAFKLRIVNVIVDVAPPRDRCGRECLGDLRARLDSHGGAECGVGRALRGRDRLAAIVFVRVASTAAVGGEAITSNLTMQLAPSADGAPARLTVRCPAMPSRPPRRTSSTRSRESRRSRWRATGR